MKQQTLEEFSKPLRSMMITCKEVYRKGKNGILTSIRFSTGDVEEKDRISCLQEAYDLGTKKFVDELITMNLQDTLVTGYHKGNSSLLEPRYRRFYQKCVLFESEKCTVCFTDLAMQQFRKTIYQLEKRCKSDCLTYVRDTLQDSGVYNMGLHVLSYHEEDSLSARMHHGRDPKTSLVMSRHIPEGKVVDREDIQELQDAIDIFVQSNGLFHYVTWGKDELIAYNAGSMKITGLEKAPEMREKVFQFVKRRERK